MRTAIIVMLLLVACIACYMLGYRSGSKQSPLREDREGELVYSLGMHHAAEATNLTKVHSFLNIKILAYTRDYERRFGVPSATNSFAKYFTEAQVLSSQIEKLLVPVSSIGTALGSNVSVRVESAK